MKFVYVIAQEGVKFGINFTSCSENGNEIARGAAECYFAVIATTSGIYPKISLLLVLSQINTIASFIKVKISYFQTRFHNDVATVRVLRPDQSAHYCTFFAANCEKSGIAH